VTTNLLIINYKVTYRIPFIVVVAVTNTTLPVSAVELYVKGDGNGTIC